VGTFRHEMFVKHFYRIFLLPLPKNAQKRTTKKAKEMYLGLVGSSKGNQIYVEVCHFVLEGPLK
jgi:hypothetical protein